MGEPNKDKELSDAVEHGMLETVSSLLDQYGLGVSEVNGYELLRNSVHRQQTEITKLLLLKGAIVNSKRNEDDNRETPLHFAVLNGDIECVKLLLRYNAEINAQIGNTGRTPLTFAIRGKEEEIVDILLDGGAYCSMVELCTAIQGGSLKITKKLLQHGAPVNCIDNSKVLFIPLLLAARSSTKSPFVELLLKYGANVNSVTTKGLTALHLAVKYGNVETMEMLLNHKGNVNVDARSNDMLTPLHLAVKNYHIKAAKLLMTHGADINAKFQNGETILNLAVSTGQTELVKEILKYNPVKNDATSKNIIKLAANHIRMDLEMVQHLINYGFPMNSNDVPILLPKAIEESNIEIIQYILDNGLHLACSKNVNCNFLHLAVKFKLLEIAKLFLDNGVDINSTDEFGKRAIYYSVKNCDVIMTKVLLSHGASVEKSPELLRVATSVVCKDIVEILLQNKVDIEATDEYGRTALHINAVKPLSDNESYYETKGEIAKLLLGMGANVDAKIYPDGLTALHIACDNILPNVVKALLEYKADVNCIAANRSPLMIAAENCNATIMKMLITNGAIVNLNVTNGDTALHIAAKRHCTDTFQILLENGADVYSKNSLGQTPLHQAVTQPPFGETVSLLLQHMPLIDLKDEYGKTPLHWAVETDNIGVVSLLLDSGSDINILCNNYTLFDIIVEAGRNSPSFDFLYPNDNERGERLWMVILQHLIKLRTANLYVHEKYIHLIRTHSNNFGNLLPDCVNEIETLKLEKIANKMSLYDILTKNIHSLATYVRNKDIIRFFESDHYKRKFKIYAPFIERNLKRAKRRCLLVERGQEFFTCYLQLPIYCSERILMYLNDADLESIINASKIP